MLYTGLGAYYGGGSSDYTFPDLHIDTKPMARYCCSSALAFFQKNFESRFFWVVQAKLQGR